MNCYQNLKAIKTLPLYNRTCGFAPRGLWGAKDNGCGENYPSPIFIFSFNKKKKKMGSFFRYDFYWKPNINLRRPVRSYNVKVKDNNIGPAWQTGTDHVTI